MVLVSSPQCQSTGSAGRVSCTVPGRGRRRKDRLMLLPSFGLLLPALLCLGVGRAETVGPIIGIFRQPSFSKEPACGGNCEYIAGSYVKWIESAGGRVVTIPYNTSTAHIDAVFDGINGLLLPGGSSVMSEAAEYMISKAIKANYEGDYFPVWGTCMGWEWIAQVVGGMSFQLDSGMDSENLTLALDLTPEADSSRMLSGAPRELLEVLGREAVTFNNHHKGVTIQKFQTTEALHSFFRVLSVNRDRVGVPFVSTVEARDEGMPVYAVQWHPEKNVFEWGETDEGTAYEAIPHSPHAQAITNYLSQFLVQEARRNGHAFKDESMKEKSLIYQYSPVYSGQEYVTSYYFNK